MASSTNLEERFNIAVRTIQNLPPNGILQLSNLTKLIFYGLYKQATVGSCQGSRPSMFNYVARAKWEAWERYRGITKEQAMREYIDEIRKIIEKMPETDEVLAFAKSMGLSKVSGDNQHKENDSIVDVEKLEHQTTNNDAFVITNESAQTLVATGNGSMPSSSSTSSSSISSSDDIDEFYDDPLDLGSLETVSNNNFQQQTVDTTGLLHHPPSSPQVHSNQNGTIIPIRHSNRHSNVSSTRVTSFQQVPYSTSSIAYGRDGSHHPTNNYNKETQRAILTALTKLQRDIHNILERLNRLETSAQLLQQTQLSLSSKLNSSSKWFPLSGFRRGAIAFILFWPFIAYILIRLYLRAKIIIRFRR